MNNQKGSTLEIMFLSLIGFSLLVASTEFSQNMAFAAVKTNSTNMMITDTDTKMVMNGFCGMSLNNKTGTMLWRLDSKSLAAASFLQIS